jgi:hypothetical protein
VTTTIIQSTDRRPFFAPRLAGEQSVLPRDPSEDRARVGDDGPVGQLERRELRVSGGLAQFVARTLPKEWDRVAVGGDDLSALDSRCAERLLHPATGMYAWAAVIAVADVQGRCLGHGILLQLVARPFLLETSVPAEKARITARSLPATRRAAAAAQSR